MAKLIIQTTIVNISSNSISLALTLELLGLDELSVNNFLELRKLFQDINFITIMKDISIKGRGLGGLTIG